MEIMLREQIIAHSEKSPLLNVSIRLSSFLITLTHFDMVSSMSSYLFALAGKTSPAEAALLEGSEEKKRK